MKTAKYTNSRGDVFLCIDISQGVEKVELRDDTVFIDGKPTHFIGILPENWCGYGLDIDAERVLGVFKNRSGCHLFNRTKQQWAFRIDPVEKLRTILMEMEMEYERTLILQTQIF